jgi:sulfoxide reductase heme-binding subunit YedZ
VTSANDHLFWITSRAAGSTALLLASAGVAAGLLMGTKLVRGKRAGDLQALHEVLALATLVSIAVHALSLVFDSFLHPSIVDVLVPFAFGYQRLWTTVGIFAGYGLMALGLSYYARKRIGPARWRKAHRFTALAWVMGIAHSLGEGTDAGTAWFLVLMGVAVVPTAVLLVARLAGVRRRADDRRPPTPPAPRQPRTQEIEA